MAIICTNQNERVFTTLALSQHSRLYSALDFNHPAHFHALQTAAVLHVPRIPLTSGFVPGLRWLVLFFSGTQKSACTEPDSGSDSDFNRLSAVDVWFSS